jgi:hypothetical protein
MIWRGKMDNKISKLSIVFIILGIELLDDIMKEISISLKSCLKIRIPGA